MIDIVLGLGSNLGDREKNLNNAINVLNIKKIISKINKSTILETRAIMLKNSPASWNLDYLNIVIKGKTDLLAEDLLRHVKKTEIELGRTNQKKWSPRIIDIDIIAYDHHYINNELLTVPHQELLNRQFVIEQFAQIWPDWKYPVAGKYFNKTIQELLVAKSYA